MPAEHISTKAGAIPPYPRGSEWRRWDLHVHTPASVLENQFGQDWAHYLDALEEKIAAWKVAVIGVTDYCSIDGYEHLLEEQAKGRLAGVLFIPNIEFRLSVETRYGGGVNLHFLISPDDPNHVAEIKRVLRNLTFEYRGSPYGCGGDELIRLGRTHDRRQTDERGAYKAGVEVFKPGFETFKDWWKSETWLQKNALRVLDNGTRDGASGLSRDGGFAAVRSELYCFADMIFSPTDACRAYFLGQGADDAVGVKEKCGSLKPCIHGSDAHSYERLLEPVGKRYCWIKADPTFEGLRQLLCEPEERVHIGPTAPESFDNSKVITSIAFENAGGWFDAENIDVNAELVTIIGEKGSGKTALVDVIAQACGAWEPVPGSFLKKAEGSLKGARVRVVWGNGSVSPAPLDAANRMAFPRARYLSQDFVERLCSEDHSGSDLLREIEDVIFSYIQEEDRLGASGFQELRTIKTGNIQDRRAGLRSEISGLNSEVVRLEEALATRPDKRARISTIDEELAALAVQIPELESGVDQVVAEELKKAREALQLSTAKLAEVNRQLETIRKAEGAATRLATAIDAEFERLRVLLEDIGLTEDEITRFRPVFPADYDRPLRERKSLLEEQAKALRGEPGGEADGAQTVLAWRAKIMLLESKLSEDQKQRERLVALQQRKALLEKEKEKILIELEGLEKRTQRDLVVVGRKRLEAYRGYFALLDEEEAMLSSLYEPLSGRFPTQGRDGRGKFELSVRRTIDIKSWAENGEGLIDRRKARDFRVAGELQRYAEEVLAPHWDGDGEGPLGKAIDDVLVKILGDKCSLSEVLLSHVSQIQFYDWLFSLEHIRVDYNLKYDGVALEYLSPGTRGILLLVLYLEMDKDDRRPLIIDQPEGNLDNSSIYDSLVPYLRRAKKHRQIILVTHNPNLVAGTDAEQVIVATARKEGGKHPRLFYASGALECVREDCNIRNTVCRLLEGGAEAFRKREERYALTS